MANLKTRLRAALRPVYRYQIVRGCGVYCIAPMSLQRARKLAPEVAARHGEAVELERVLMLPNGARRYWRHDGKRWVYTHLTDYSNPETRPGPFVVMP